MDHPTTPDPAAAATRRGFLRTLSGLGAAAAALPTLVRAATPARPANARYMGDFAAPKLDAVKVAFIGVGARGSGHCSQLAVIEGVQVVAICDLVEGRAKGSENEAKKHNHAPKIYFGKEDAWRQMLLECKPDAVIIATPWELHAPMCIGAMKAGAHAFTEVPMAYTLEDLWQIIDTSETTGRHCMMMENVNYGREELVYLNMVRQGLLGELLHGEAAYLHPLCGQMDGGDSTGSWRTFHYARRNGNLYPTHGLGPVAQYMSLVRTEDHFRRLVSFSSPNKGRNLYKMKSQRLTNPEFRNLDFKGGDLNTSIVKTMLGRTIMIQWDETSPRPYTRHNLIQGTKGIMAGFPNRMSVEGLTKPHDQGWAENDEWEKIAAQYEHPLFKRMGELSKKMGGHGGMDFLMLFRIVECLRTGQPLDQNVYEGASWSAVGPLSEASVAQDGAPQDFPDFTRGQWTTTKPLGIIA